MSDGNGVNQDDIETPVMKVREAKVPEMTVFVAAMDSATRTLAGVLAEMKTMANAWLVSDKAAGQGERDLLAGQYDMGGDALKRTANILRTGRP